MNKPTIVLACILLNIAPTAYSQADDVPPVHLRRERFTGSELIAAHGLVPSSQLFSGAFRRIKYTNERYTGALSLTYRYHLNGVISLGVMVAFEHEKGTWNRRPGWQSYLQTASPPMSGAFTRASYTIAPELTLIYGEAAHGMIRFYSVVGVGYTRRMQTTTPDAGTDPIYASEFPNPRPLHFNGYASPFGMRFGRALGGFLEIGVGYKGLINYGMTYRF